MSIFAPGGVLRAQAQGAIEIDHGRGEPSLIAGSFQHDLAVLIDPAAAIEDQPIVRADQIRIGERALTVSRARRDQLTPGLQHTDPKR